MTGIEELSEFSGEHNNSGYGETIYPTYTLPPMEPHCNNQPNLVFGSIIIALVVIGLVGNSLVFFTILVLHEYKKSVTNWYILMLTLADTLFLLMLPFTAHSEVIGKWEFSYSLCQFKEAVLFINYYASIYFLVVMSFDRYLAVTKAFDSRKWMTLLRSPTSSYVITAIGWIFSALMCVQLYRYSTVTSCGTCEYAFPLPEPEPDYLIGFPDIFDLNTDDDSNLNETNKFLKDSLPQSYREEYEGLLPNSHTFTCQIHSGSEFTIWVYGNFAGAFILPFVLICYFYGMIMKTVRSASLVESNVNHKSYRRRVTMIVLGLVSLFAISWLPWYVDKIIKLHGINVSEETCYRVTVIVRGIAYMNSSFNPYFYSFLGFHFRDRLKRAGSRVRVVMSMRAKSYRTSSLKRRHYNSSSISAGPRQHLHIPASRSSVQNRGNDRGGVTPIGASCPRTEKTEV